MGWLAILQEGVVVGFFLIFGGLMYWLRRDAKRDAKRDFERGDFHHAQDIHDAAADARRDHADGVRPYETHGWRNPDP